MTNFNLIFKVVFGFYLAAFVVMRAYHFYHGFRHGLATLDGDLAMGEKCRTDIIVKSRTPDCAHYEAMTRFEPFWTGCEHLWNNSFLLISVSVADAAKHIIDTFGMFVGYMLGVAMLAVLVGVVFLRLIMTVAPAYKNGAREKYIEAGDGDVNLIEYSSSGSSIPRYRTNSNRIMTIDEK